MGAGKTSLVLRFVKGQFHEYQVHYICPTMLHDNYCICSL